MVEAYKMLWIKSGWREDRAQKMFERNWGI